MKPASAKIFLLRIIALIGLSIGMGVIMAQSEQPTRVARVDVGAFIYNLTWSPDGQSLAAATDKGIFIFDSSLQLVSELETPNGGPYRAESVSWSPDGTRLASADGLLFNMIRVWEYDETATIWFQAHQILLPPDLKTAGVGIPTVSWSPDSSRLAALVFRISEASDYGGEFFGLLYIWGTDTWELQTRSEDPFYFGPHYTENFNRNGMKYDVIWSPTGQYVATTGSYRCFSPRCQLLNTQRRLGAELSIINANNGKLEPGFRQIGYADHIIWPAPNDLIVSDCVLKRFNVETRQLISRFFFNRYCGSNFTLSPDGEMLLWRTPKRDFEIRHLNTNIVLARIGILESNFAIDYVWSSRNYIAFLDGRGYIELWDVNNLPDVPQVATVTPIPTETQ